jgi:hypothetical protein
MHEALGSIPARRKRNTCHEALLWVVGGSGERAFIGKERSSRAGRLCADQSLDFDFWCLVPIFS